MLFDKGETYGESFASGTIGCSTTGEDPTTWARRSIAQLTTKANKIPLFYRESLRYIISKMGNLYYLNPETELVGIKCVHANPERTVAKLNQDNNIILPIVSINQSMSHNDDNRRRNSPTIINEVFWSEKKKRAVRVISEAPRAVTIEHGINVWAKYGANMDQICEQIRLLFNPHMVVKTTYTNVAQAFIEMENNNSSLEVDDREERILRRTFIIKLEAYIPNPKFVITSTGEIEELNIDCTIY